MGNPVTELSSKDLKPSGTIGSLPIDVVHGILVRLPVKLLLRCRAVCKEWRGLIHSRMFIKDHLEKSLAIPFARSALLLAFQDSTPGTTSNETSFYSLSLSGDRIRRLLKLPNSSPDNFEMVHINGLILYHRKNGYVGRTFAYIVNPSYPSALNITPSASTNGYSQGNAHICYFFGFDPTCNDYKVLSISLIGLLSNPRKIKIQCAVFSLQSRSWKMVEPAFPFDILSEDWLEAKERSVCVNGVIHILLKNSYAIVSFDLREDKFSILEIPAAAIPSEDSTLYIHLSFCKFNHPCLLNWNGSLAVACHEHLVLESKIEVWILKDYENQAWVMETIPVPCDLGDFANSFCVEFEFPVDFIVTGEIMFSLVWVASEWLKLRFYCIKTRTLRSAEIHMPAESSTFRCKFAESSTFRCKFAECVPFIETVCPLI